MEVSTPNLCTAPFWLRDSSITHRIYAKRIICSIFLLRCGIPARYRTAMNTTPWWKQPTRAQWMSFLAAWVGWVLDAFDFTIYIVVAGSIIKEFGVSPVAIGGSLTLTLLVRMLGGMVAGWMADCWGRRLPLMISLVWFAVFDAAIYFAPTFGTLLVLRTLFGFGMGAEWTAGTALAMESFPTAAAVRVRPAAGRLAGRLPARAAAAYFVVPAFGWRAMFLIAALPALLVIPLRFIDHRRAQAASQAKAAARARRGSARAERPHA